MNPLSTLNEPSMNPLSTANRWCLDSEDSILKKCCKFLQFSFNPEKSVKIFGR